MKLGDHEKEAFLLDLREHGLETTAARNAGVRMALVRKAYDDDEIFRQSAEEIVDLFVDKAEQELYRRAVHGIDKPVFHQGIQTDTMKEYSDTLLIKYMTARRPKQYGNKQQITGENDGPLKIRIASFDVPSGASDESDLPDFI